MSNLYSNLHKLYPVQKTLRFELIPQGKTKENMEKKGIIREDEHRAKIYNKVKKYCDEYHKIFIEDCLKDIKLDNLNRYYELYSIDKKDEDQKEEFTKIQEKIRKQISESFKKDSKYKGLFQKDIIDTYLIKIYKEDKQKLQDINEFNKFTTYFTGYNKNRENMYLEEEKSTAIAYRLINENLPTFVDNLKIYNKLLKFIPEIIEKIHIELAEYIQVNSIDEIFDISYYNDVLTQKGIECYNIIISGKTKDDGTKIKGINEYINEYNQTHTNKIPKLRELYKQILSDTDTASFRFDGIEDDIQLLDSINLYYQQIFPIISKVNELFSKINNYNLDLIYINNDGTLSNVSNEVYSDWSYIRNHISEEYDIEYTGRLKIGTEQYSKQKQEYLRKQKNYSLGFLINCLKDDKITEYLSNNMKRTEIVEKIKMDLDNFQSIQIQEDYKYLIKNENSIAKIKKLLDDTKLLQVFMKTLIPKDKTIEKDNEFYSELISYYDVFRDIIPLYNKTRNYLTQKPYSNEKIKINFACPTLLNGWDLNKEEANLGVILLKDEKYYLGIMNPYCKKIFNVDNRDSDTNNNYKKMEYKLLPGPNKMLPKVFFSKSRISEFAPSDELLEKYNKGYHKKGKDFDVNFCHELINFYKKSLNKHEDWKNFNFKFKDTAEYNDISEFYREVEEQGYKIEYKEYSEQYINELVERGELYLFQIYNKDFSEYSKGRQNLHTMYWKAVFDPENIKDTIYKLNGNAEIFYRKKSIDEKITHPANIPVANKNENTIKAGKITSLFKYNLIKDKRYTVDKFQFHVPITMNFKSEKILNINQIVNKYLKYNDDIHVIGIDRGERNLLYVCVIDKDEKIVYQKSLNEIYNEYQGIQYSTNYHKLLNEKENEREQAREDWKNIENIKELKEGYMSQIIHILCELMRKYNAIIVIEDLNKGFKNSRIKVEKQIYQKFEQMFINKLNYVVFKDVPKLEEGGILNAYQLTNKFESFTKLGKQSGILYYIPAWCTSKIDPTTGFINRFYIKYENFEKSKEFVNRIDDIRYNPDEGLFEFDIDYSKFSDRLNETRNKWTLCSYGERVYTHKNNKEIWVDDKIQLTDEFIKLFKKYNIDLNNIKNEISGKADIEFFKGGEDSLGFLQLFKLMVQMRNSITGQEEDNLISPVRNNEGIFFDTKAKIKGLPEDADANGAYNIARKGLMLIEQMKRTDDDKLNKIKYDITEKEWLNYIQNRGV